MRLCARLFGPRVIPKEPVPLKQNMPLQLKSYVSGKGDSTKEVSCLHEMSVLFACLKDNEFSQSPCSKEIESFKGCYETHLKTSKMKKEKQAKGILTPGEKKLSYRQVNTLLRKFPDA